MHNVTIIDNYLLIAVSLFLGEGVLKLSQYFRVDDNKSLRNSRQFIQWLSLNLPPIIWSKGCLSLTEVNLTIVIDLIDEIILRLTETEFESMYVLK